MTRGPLISLILAFVVLVASLGGYALWYASVSSLSARAASLATEIAAKQSDVARIAQAKVALASLSKQEQTLRAYFVSTSDVVSFLEELQSTGKAFGTTVEVVSVSSTGEGKAAHLSIALKIDGSFDGVVRTLGALEYSPRDIVVNDAALGISGKAHWTATALITVGTRVKPKVPAPVKPAATASTTATTTP